MLPAANNVQYLESSKRKLWSKKDTPPLRYGGIPYLPLVYTVSTQYQQPTRTLGGATYRVPCVPVVERAIDASMHTVPHIPTGTGDTNYCGASFVNFGGR